MIKPEDCLFPYSEIRKTQDSLIEEIDKSIRNKKSLIVHAPTGLGKTIAALGPALKFAMGNDLSIFFLTSRHTQHLIAIDTLRKIKQKYNLNLIVSDIIGKKWMCSQDGADKLMSNEFADYCKALREDGSCDFYINTKKNNKITVGAKKIFEELKELSPLHTEQVIEICTIAKVCPYEISLMLASKSKVIIADYFYIFNPSIRNGFFAKTDKELEKCIIIVDEGHNLPNRSRELMTQKLSNFMIIRAIKEGKKFGFGEAVEKLSILLEVLINLANNIGKGSNERLINKEELVESIKLNLDYDELVNELVIAGDDIREIQKRSYIGSIGNFLEAWQGSDEGFSRILSKISGYRDPLVVLTYRCLDPSIITKEVFGNSYSNIIMSGTLSPTNMYKDILGIENSVEKVFDSPFPEKNKLALIIPKTTTKYTSRTDQQFKDIAKVLAEIINAVPGNSAVFFPSYFLRDRVNEIFSPICHKTIFLENPKLNKKEKKAFLERFKKYKDSGAVILGAASGSFGEGIDLPGDLLKCVVVVGLPLGPPDLEIKELIRYYDNKFSKGWDYGYLFPAFIKSLQNAGRCIRSEKDKGVIVFLDERFCWENYYRCFPRDMGIKVSKEYVKEIKGFFEENL